MSTTTATTEKEKYGHYRTKHVDQMELRQLRLSIVKLHDLNKIDSKLRDELLENPFQMYHYPEFTRFIVRSMCNDTVHCDLDNKDAFGKPSVDPYTKIHNYQKKQIYLNTKSWEELRSQVIESAKYICSQCHHDYGNGHNLVAHHKDQNYPNLYAEKPSDLECKCDLCHSKLHGLIWMYQMPKKHQVHVPI